MRSRENLSALVLTCGLWFGCARSDAWDTQVEHDVVLPEFPTESCGPQVLQVTTEHPKVLLLLDRSASMQDPPETEDPDVVGTTSKWDLVLPALDEVIAQTDTALDWGMKSFPEGDGTAECAAESVTSRIDVSVASSNASRVVEQIGLTTPQGSGTPTGDAVRSALAYLLTLPAGPPKFLILATDGEPSCAGTTKGQETARPYAIEALQQALSSGVPTFVVGVATNKESATNALNAMAVAGGQPRAVTRDTDPRYYLGNTQDELLSALSEITADLTGSCSIVLHRPPESPELARLRISGAEVPRDLTHQEGWDFVGTERIQTFGAACDRTRKAAPGSLEIVYGCVQALP
ncbi:MAG TPA: vWA domain-containing protein [Polyangiaceae bacterium]|nr:vWA domain-containing protein [Polyangiaceae bacterium]